MGARSFVTFIVFCFSYFFICSAQPNDYIIRHQIDSLSKIQNPSFIEYKPQGKRLIVSINNQRQFDEINNLISRGIESGYKNIKIKLGKGVYIFKENHIRRKKEMHGDVSITIEGYGAVITSNQKYDAGEGESEWCDIIQLDETIEIVDAKKKICRVPLLIKDDSNVSLITKIQIPQWYKAPTYNVTKIDRTGVYFVVPELKYEDSYERKGYNVNMDYLYKGKYPRYRLFDKSKSGNFAASKFINIDDCEFRSITIKGIAFSGNKEGNELISINNVTANQVLIKDCCFKNIKGTIGYFSATNNVSISKNKIKETDGDEFVFTKGCLDTRITENYFEDCGKGLRNTFCVKCVECEYYVSNNIFVNFGYGAIGVGVWEGLTKKFSSRGIIEHNEAYYTPDYFAQSWKHNLIDSGVIYTWTQNDDVIIRYNYIHDYTGVADNRGIFCDDGASNIKIYGNIVVNTPNSYSIAARQVNDLRTDYQNNSNNLMSNNIIDGNVCFMGYGLEERHCRKGSNIILHGSEAIIVKNKIANLELEGIDVNLIGCFYNNGKVHIQRKNKKEILRICRERFILSKISFS